MGITILPSGGGGGPSSSSPPVLGGSQFFAPSHVTTVANATTSLIASAATRITVWVSSKSTNTADITLTVSGGAANTGYIMEPGDSIPLATTAEVFYHTSVAGQTISLCEVRV